MAETLGSLFDKLIVVKLKQWHSENSVKLNNLKTQEQQLISEIDDYTKIALEGNIPIEKLTFPANKVYKNNIMKITTLNLESFGAIFSELAHINCALWHVQEKVYDFKNVPSNQKNEVIEQLASLNLQRNHYIDEVDHQFAKLIKTTLIQPLNEGV